MQRPEHSPDSPQPVNWKVEDRRRVLIEGLTGNLLAGYRGRGDYEQMGRQALAKRSHQWPCGFSFTDGDTVQPNDGSSGRVQRRNFSQTLTETGDVLTAAKRIDGKPGKQEQKAESQQEAVDQIHGLNQRHTGCALQLIGLAGALDIAAFIWIDANAIAFVDEWRHLDGNAVFERGGFIHIRYRGPF